MRNAVAAMLAVAMLVTSALIALEIAVLLRTPIHVMAPEAADAAEADPEPLLRAFYDAANAILAGERAPVLATVISPKVQTHAATGPAAHGETGLRTYLESTRQHGAVSIDVIQVIGSGTDVAAVVDARERSSFRRRRVDLFRVEAGTIIGYWPGTASARTTTSLPHVTMPAPSAIMGVSLTRLELGPDAEPTILSAPIPHLLLVESGALTIARETAFQFARAGEPHLSPLAGDSGADDMRLGPGDVLLLAQAASYRVWNDGESSASALSLVAEPSFRLFHQVRAGSSTLPTVETMHDAWRVGRRTAWDNDTVTETLAVKSLPDGPRMVGVELRGTQVSVDLGQHIPPLPPGNLRLAIVRSGVVGVSVINSDAVPISVPRPDSQLVVAANHLFWAGDAFWIETSESPVLANAGVTPLDILLIDVVPLKDDAATPTSYTTAPLQT